MDLYVDRKRQTIQFDVTEPNENMIKVDLSLEEATNMHRDEVKTYVDAILAANTEENGQN